ncbi:MAG: hypothetical protein EOO42_04335 [Flavobacteriales bacterium]|nr:MAG: hypothetical protein EOO42_04335 [Flavobacteriales bacterium]
MIENINLKNRLAKIYELVKRGTEGEKNAAQNALDKLLAKYNLEGIDLDNLDKSIYKFKYKTQLDEWLLLRIVHMFTDGSAMGSAIKNTWNVREIQLSLTYLDFITVSASYEYFKRHMALQWKKICADDVKRKRKASTKAKRRAELQQPFFSRYVIASKLYKDGELTTHTNTTQKEKETRRLMQDVEGGQYNKQVTNGLLLEN